jgi:hypothetical protein
VLERSDRRSRRRLAEDPLEPADVAPGARDLVLPKCHYRAAGAPHDLLHLGAVHRLDDPDRRRRGVGTLLGLGGEKGVPGREATIAQWFAWLFSDAALATVSGLFVIATISAVVGYGVSLMFWRWWQGRKWRRRARERPRDV